MTDTDSVLAAIRDTPLARTLGLSQSEQKTRVADFQKRLYLRLQETLPGNTWTLEQLIGDGRDRADIYGASPTVVIEIDKARADQIAKKFVSRMALLADRTPTYVAVCIPGTAAMNKTEATKYFGFCSTIASKMGGEFLGVFKASEQLGPIGTNKRR